MGPQMMKMIHYFGRGHHDSYYTRGRGGQKTIGGSIIPLASSTYYVLAMAWYHIKNNQFSKVHYCYFLF